MLVFADHHSEQEAGVFLDREESDCFMARPKKIGLDYFPVDVVFDDKVQSIELLHGNNGFVWVIKFWQSAYQTETGEIDISGLFGELHANKCRISTEEHYKILETAIKIGFCYKTENDLYTSNGIKKRIGLISQERLSAIERQEERKSKIKSKDKVKETPHYSANNLFNSFWDMYPKKTGKGAAEKSWSKITEPEKTLELIKISLEWQKQSDQWKKENGQFIPMPATYLNQRRWEDQPINERAFTSTQKTRESILSGVNRE